MVDQLSFASLNFAGKKKRTKSDVFLAEMTAVVPWAALEALIEQRYPKLGAKGKRRPFPLGFMLRIYCLQQWYGLSDPDAEEALSSTLKAGLSIPLASRPGVSTTRRPWTN